MKEFMRRMFDIPVGWIMWLMLLMLVNMAIPLLYISYVEALLVILAFMVAFMTGVVLYKMQGFTRLLGAMHWTWIPLSIYLFGKLGQIPADEFYGIWIRGVIVLNGISLLLDTIDVVRYGLGDRRPIN